MDANKADEGENNQLESQNCHDASYSSSFRQRNQNKTLQSKEYEVYHLKFFAGYLAVIFF